MMSQNSGSPASILVVDDDDAVRRVLRSMLESVGYLVREAPNGKVAMREFERQPADLLITDIFMPEQEGMETIGALRRQHPSLAIIAISGMAGDYYLKMAQFLGVRATLLKPLGMQKVLDTVQTVLEQLPSQPANAA
jgi:YesN/AraC family two-component response regulator